MASFAAVFQSPLIGLELRFAAGKGLSCDHAERKQAAGKERCFPIAQKRRKSVVLTLQALASVVPPTQLFPIGTQGAGAQSRR
jgi:hypothetical protein